MTTNETNDQWATVELMGHAQTAGRISRPSDWGGLLRVDVPGTNGDYRTEFYGMSAIYSVKLVSEEIARAYAQPQYDAHEYDAPIIPREVHQAKLAEAHREANRWQMQVTELQRRLTAINALPAPNTDAGPDDNGPAEQDDDQ